MRIEIHRQPRVCFSFNEWNKNSEIKICSTTIMNEENRLL